MVHRDFTPWNIRGSPGAWKVLDWERGERVGMPLWDWLHFVVQTAILVAQAKPEEVATRIEQLLASASVERYLRLTETLGWERPICLAYLEYCERILRPSEGIETLKQTARILRSTWVEQSG